MSDDKALDGKIPTVSTSPERIEELMNELKNRLMLVTDHTLNHLRSHGVLDITRAAGCCKPDGGTCCVRKQN